MRKLKSNEPRPKFTGSYKKKRVCGSSRVTLVLVVLVFKKNYLIFSKLKNIIVLTEQLRQNCLKLNLIQC